MWHVGIASFALIFMPLPPRAPTAGRHTGQMATVHMIATAPSASTGAKRGERRGTRDSAVSDETMRWYLKSISSRRLLENHEEVSLAVAVKRLLLWQKAKTTLADALGLVFFLSGWLCNHLRALQAPIFNSIFSSSVSLP